MFACVCWGCSRSCERNLRSLNVSKPVIRRGSSSLVCLSVAAAMKSSMSTRFSSVAMLRSAFVCSGIFASCSACTSRVLFFVVKTNCGYCIGSCCWRGVFIELLFCNLYARV